MRLCPKDENFRRHAEQFLSLWVGFFQPSGPVSESRKKLKIHSHRSSSHCLYKTQSVHKDMRLKNIEHLNWYSNCHFIPVIINKSYEEWVEGIQVSDQYGELVHDEKLSLGHLTPSFCLAVLLIHQHNGCFLQHSQQNNCLLIIESKDASNYYMMPLVTHYSLWNVFYLSEANIG